MLCNDCRSKETYIEKLKSELHDLNSKGSYSSNIESIESDLRYFYQSIDNCPDCEPKKEISRDLFGLDLSELDEIDTAVVDDILKIEKQENYLVYDNADLAIKLLRALHNG